MLKWIYENISTIIAGGLLFAAMAAVIFHMIRNRASGKSSCGCGCGCSGCSQSGTCGKKN